MITLDKELSEMVFLLIDDEPDNIATLAKSLEHFGALVFSAADGKSGFEVLKSITPSMIFLDLSMPGMDGWEMLKVLRADEKYHYLPVIALTAHAMIGDKEKVLAAGFDGYISKPFRPSMIIEEIKRALSPSI